MDIQELKYVLALAEYQNFTVAAEACSLSQSSLSKHLLKIEEEIGNISLFDRSKRPVLLTTAGEEFVQYARRITEEYETLLLSMEKYKVPDNSTLRIGIIPVIGRFGFIPLIKSFKETLSPVDSVEIIDRPSKELLKLLEKNEIDLALLAISPNQALKTSLTSYHLMENELCLIVNEKHRFAHRSSVNLNEMSAEVFAIPDNETGMYDLCLSACEASGAKLKKVKTYRNIETILDLVEDGECVSLLTARLLFTYKRQTLRAVHLTHPVKSIIALVIQNSAKFNGLTHDFVDFARNWRVQLDLKEF
ncbi:LysR family transcriptional regulator [Emergencia timonensis]|uniref:LysR family transcriptional regulator n=1 Tax=Emergencia timonensis TaxID=1776384 RepID=UPI003991BC40